MNTSPFLFGKIVSDATFVDRQKEIKKIKSNTEASINTMILSPRRWGKSSLIKKVGCEAESKNLRFCYIDLFKCESEEAFFNMFAQNVLKVTTSKWEEFVQNSKIFLKNLIPQFSFGVDPGIDFKLSISWEQIEKNKEQILNIPEEIYQKKGIKLVVCIDEFQNITKYPDSLALQSLLRSVWQYQKNTTYILYGSKRHALNEMFSTVSEPFYKFGDTIFLEKIATKHWITYIKKAFVSSGKAITPKFAEQIATTMDNHPYFVQQYAHHVWQLTDQEVTADILIEALDNLLTYNQIMYIREVENLTPTQLNFLRALLDQVTQFSSVEVLKKYSLGTSGNIKKIKMALEEREVVDFFETKPIFNDPSFALWLKKYFFE